MQTSIENFLKLDENHEAFYQVWSCDKPKAVIFLTHGIGEHSGSYDLFAKMMAKHNIQVFGWDLRGHGRSSGQRGYVSNFKDYCQDFKKVFKFFTSKDEFNNLPIILVGHSMGGTVLLRSFIEQKPKQAVAICLSSPCLGIKNKPSQAKETLAQFANKYLPRLSLSNEIRHENLSQMPEQIELYKKDSLRHNKITSRTYQGMLESFEIIFKKPNKLNIPIYFQVSENDNVVDSNETIKLFDSIDNKIKSISLYKNSMHEIYNDIEQKQVTDELAKFINTFVEGQ